MHLRQSLQCVFPAEIVLQREGDSMVLQGFSDEQHVGRVVFHNENPIFPHIDSPDRNWHICTIAHFASIPPLVLSAIPGFGTLVKTLVTTASPTAVVLIRG